MYIYIDQKIQHIPSPCFPGLASAPGSTSSERASAARAIGSGWLKTGATVYDRSANSGKYEEIVSGNGQ